MRHLAKLPSLVFLTGAFTSTALAGGAGQPIIAPAKPVPIMVPKVPQPKMQVPKTQAPAAPRVTVAAPAVVKPVIIDSRLLIDRVLKAYGGIETLSKVNNISIMSNSTFYGPNGLEVSTVESEIVVDYSGNRYRESTKSGSELIVNMIVIDGKGYIEDKNGLREANNEEFELAKASIYGDSVGFYKLSQMPGTQFRALGEQTWLRLDDRALVGQALEVQQGTHKAVFLIDKDGHILAEKISTSEMGDMILAYVQREFINGISLPKTIACFDEKGNLFVVSHVNSKAVNATLDDSIFQVKR